MPIPARQAAISTPIHGAGSKPSGWVARWLKSLPVGARVLDLAAGGGRHALLARSLGARVLAVDRDAAALSVLDRAPGAAIETAVLDLEDGPWQLTAGAFDAVIVTNYLFRPRFALVCDLLAPGGLLIYETFAVGNEAFGKPSNPAFLLEEGELLVRSRAAGLTVIAYESGLTPSDRAAVVQRVCAVRPPYERARLALETAAMDGGSGALG
jgi:SAM-dependent methyltransferase